MDQLIDVSHIDVSFPPSLPPLPQRNSPLGQDLKAKGHQQIHFLINIKFNIWSLKDTALLRLSCCLPSRCIV